MLRYGFLGIGICVFSMIVGAIHGSEQEPLEYARVGEGDRAQECKRLRRISNLYRQCEQVEAARYYVFMAILDSRCGGDISLKPPVEPREGDEFVQEFTSHFLKKDPDEWFLYSVCDHTAVLGSFTVEEKRQLMMLLNEQLSAQNGSEAAQFLSHEECELIRQWLGTNEKITLEEERPSESSPK